MFARIEWKFCISALICLAMLGAPNRAAAQFNQWFTVDCSAARWSLKPCAILGRMAEVFEPMKLLAGAICANADVRCSQFSPSISTDSD